MKRERIHWQDLPTKRVPGGYLGFRVALVGDRWDAASGVLDVDGLSDISETEDAKAFLASPAARMDPPILRVLDPDVADELLVLVERNGEMVLRPIRRHDLTSPANAG